VLADCLGVPYLHWCVAARIVTGGLGGTLRVFSPMPGGFKVDHLVLEQELEEPILQLGIGKFAAGTTSNALAVLHPRSLVVYEVLSRASSASAEIETLTLRQLYSHSFGSRSGTSFTAHSMCFGPFGGAGDVDHICVQSMDGQLSFFEQDRHSFTRQLDAVLLPGPIAYVSRIDCIVTVDCTLYARAYRYSALMSTADSLAMPGAVAAAAAGPPGTKEAKPSRKLVPEWSINVGEPCDTLLGCRVSAGLTDAEVDILAIGKRTLLCMKERGVGSSKAAVSGGSQQLSGSAFSASTMSAIDPYRLQRRLDFAVAASCVYLGDGTQLPSDGCAGLSRPGVTVKASAVPPATTSIKQRIILASNDGQLFVYSGSRLVWAARLPDGADSRTVAICVGKFGELSGLVTHLSDAGKLILTYMGTDPPTTSAEGLGTRGKDMDPGEVEAENKRLLRIIREAQGVKSDGPSCGVVARLHVSPIVSVREGVSPASRVVPELSGTLFVTFTGDKGQEARRVRATLGLPDCVECDKSYWEVGTLGAGGSAAGEGATSAGSVEPIELPFRLTGRVHGMPSSLTLRAAVTYVTPMGATRVAQTSVQLPLAIAFRTVPTVKSTGYRLTVEVKSGTPPPLSALFRDVFSQATASAESEDRGEAGQAVTFRSISGADVTVLASAKAPKYRVQAASFEALQLVTDELVARLKAGGPPSLRSAATGAGVVDYNDPLPLGDLQLAVREHWTARNDLHLSLLALNDRTYQLRMIQKRLLTRFRDRTPADATALNKLLGATHDQVQAEAVVAERAQGRIAASACKLRCAIRLFRRLCVLKYRLSAEDEEVLEGALPAEVQDGLEQGWEERADAALTHLLRTMTAKSKQAPPSFGSEPPGLPESSEPLERHLELLAERLEAGVRPTASMRGGTK
jgi:hypothetical protein